MRNLLFAIAVLLFCVEVSAKAPGQRTPLLDRIDECYEDNLRPRDAAYCADLALARALRKGGGQPISRSSKVFYCSEHSDPQLGYVILGPDGEITRREVIKTFTVGDDDQERVACQNELKVAENVVASGLSSSCRCDQANDPNLTVLFEDRDFNIFARVTINRLTAGDDLQEKRDCQNLSQTLPVCNL